MAKKSKKKWILLTVAGLIGISALFVWFGILNANAVGISKDCKIRIHENTNLEEVAKILEVKANLKSKSSFLFWAKLLQFKKAEPCIFTVHPNEGLWSIISKLKASKNRYTDVVINGSASIKLIAKHLSNHLEIDSAEFVSYINSSSIEKFGVTSANWFGLMVPNTYNFKCATNIEQFLGRMKEEHDKYWNAERIAKAKAQGFTPEQIVTIASIVTKESNKYEEYETIAGVYINRVRKDMLLQADPTVNFARGKDGNPTKSDLQRDHPYNTYVKKGLPPGAICVPNLQSIEATLNYKKHDYIYFCAKPELNGMHNFAVDYDAHLKNVKLYREALKKRGL